MAVDTSAVFVPESRHVSVWIVATPQQVYAVAADPRQLPRWAAGLASAELRPGPHGWIADSPMGEVTVKFAEANEYGVLDHVVTLPSGEAVYNPMRVVPGDGTRCEVVFTVRTRPGMTPEEFDADCAAVGRDLGSLRQLVKN